MFLFICLFLVIFMFIYIIYIQTLRPKIFLFCNVFCNVIYLLSSAISVELYYIFSTIWGHDHYTLYGILLIVFLILLSVTACISIALTYFQLSSEDYRWWWRSVFSSG